MRRLALAGIWLLCFLCAIMALIWMATAIIFGPSRAWKIAVGFDQLANACWGNNEDETISSMAAKAARHGVWWAKWLCVVLEAVDPGHTERAIERDRGEIVTN